MGKFRLFMGTALAAALFTACDDTTDTIGGTLTSSTDIFEMTPDTFPVVTRSFIVDSVLSRSQYNYLGRMKDPETNTYVTCNYTTQFTVLENLNSEDSFLPSKDSITSRENGEIIADSCFLRININSYQGNALNPMRLTAYEMSKPIKDGQSYYSNFDPEREGYVRTDGIRKTKMYTPIDQNLSDSLRDELASGSSSLLIPINIPLNEKYTKDGVTYKNFGTYVMQMYYKHPEYFKNSNTFRYNICPGFYFKSTGGLGVMSEISSTSLLINFKMMNNGTSTDSRLTLTGTEEVLQTNNIVNDKSRTALLAAEDTCTYLKTPAGILTEVELPVEDIMRGHEADTVSSAKIVFTRLKESKGESAFSEPTNVMILPKDSLFSFFENKDLPDNKLSYIGTYQSVYNTYTFNNISSMITAMYRAKQNGETSADWNKAVLVPITQTTTTMGSSYSTSTKVIDVSNDMSLKSTKLVGGTDNRHQPITISVIFSRFKNN